MSPNLANERSELRRKLLDVVNAPALPEDSLVIALAVMMGDPILYSELVNCRDRDEVRTALEKGLREESE